ncbi:MAG TPA: heme ABC exporter ATP-binding protein CcmA [Sphingobium sp.]|nr:heme ABC exporter ATP-binding protein CcmA [Sphingobium sp.]
MTPAALSLQSLACLRGGRLLFTGLDLDLGPGGSAQVAGPNGIGKSSLLRIVAGLLRPFAGTVQRTGAVALTDELDALDRERTVLGALRFWARMDEAPSARIDAALEALGIAHLADIPVRMLSTGQRKRAALARTLASGAPIWLLDEPANGLDVQAAATLGDVVTRHRAQGGIVLAASHLPLAWAQDVTLHLTAPHEGMLDDEAEAQTRRHRSAHQAHEGMPPTSTGTDGDRPA